MDYHRAGKRLRCQDSSPRSVQILISSLLRPRSWRWSNAATAWRFRTVVTKESGPKEEVMRVVPEPASEPCVKRNPEANLPPVDDLRREVSLRNFLEDPLPASVPDLQTGR